MTAHAHHDMHPNSIGAHRTLTGELTKRAAQVLAHLQRRGIPLTVREIAAELGYGNNLNAVAPRVTELRDAGAIYEATDVKCPVTGITVRAVKAYAEGATQ